VSAHAGPEPWIETRPGGLFFINAVLVSPIFMALYPWTLRWILQGMGIIDRPSRILDPVPAVAAHFAPFLGWLSIPAAWLVWKNLKEVDRPWARVALWAFLAAHVGMVAYTVGRWI
jgi:hypothetical protein